MRLLGHVGNACESIMDDHIRDLPCKVLQVDEIWTFVRKKQRRLTLLEFGDRSFGDQHVFVAIDDQTKVIPS